MTMRTHPKPFAGLVLWGALAVLSPTVAAEPNVIRGIDVAEKDGGVELAIQGTRAPSYTVFKLQDPPRLVVDLAGADVSQVSSPLEVGKAGVVSVSTAQYKDERSAVGRVIVALEGARRYEVAPRGDAVVVKVLDEAAEQAGATTAPTATATATATPIATPTATATPIATANAPAAARPVPPAYPAPASARDDARLAWPLQGVLYGRYGVRAGQRHDGIDIAAPEGTPVLAAGAGSVIYAGEQAGYGALVILKHDGGLVTLYAHNSKLLVGEGERVRRGQPIARVGESGRTSGPHLHFEVRDGTRPKNPLLFLP
jgi:murein DD-endopeptidase MepM/ murein hydrolase activator NlpD